MCATPLSSSRRTYIIYRRTRTGVVEVTYTPTQFKVVSYRRPALGLFFFPRPALSRRRCRQLIFGRAERNNVNKRFFHRGQQLITSLLRLATTVECCSTKNWQIVFATSVHARAAVVHAALCLLRHRVVLLIITTKKNRFFFF